MGIEHLVDDFLNGIVTLMVGSVIVRTATTGVSNWVRQVVLHVEDRAMHGTSLIGKIVCVETILLQKLAAPWGPTNVNIHNRSGNLQQTYDLALQP